MNEPEPAPEPGIQPEILRPESAPTPRPDTNEEPFWGYQDVLLLLAAALPLLIVATLLVTGLFHALSWNPPKAVQILPAQFLFYLLWFLLLYAWIRLRYNRPFWRSMAFYFPPGGFWASFGFGLLTALAVLVLGALLRPPQTDMPMLELLRDPVSVMMVGFFATTLGPLCEELAFRGFLLPLLVRSVGPVVGIILTALPFALLHGPQYGWSVGHVVLVAFAGSAFGWMRYRSGSTANATVMHSAYNLVFFIGLVAQRKELLG